jgi:uncharacterized protein (DUF885 family)
MYRFSHLAVLGFALLGPAGCGRAPAPVPAPATLPAAPREDLRRIVERYWDEHQPLEGAVAVQALADSLAIERRYLAEVLALPPAGLDPAARLTYDIFTRQRQLAIEGFTYPTELLADDPFDGMPLRFARLASDAAERPPMTPAAAGAWLRRIDGYAQWTQVSIANMREGLRRGYTSPKALIERALPPLERLGEDSAENVFYVSLESRAAPRTGLHGAIRDKLLPAYRALHEFLQQEYLPRARVGLALSELPLGPSWYAYRVKCATGSALTPGEIHRIGKAEVERLHTRMGTPPAAAPLAARTGGAAGAGIADGALLLDAYRDLEAHAVTALAVSFSAAPPTDFEIRAGGPWRQDDAPLVYQPAEALPADASPSNPGGSQPAILYVNAAPSAERPAAVLIGSFLEQALPGHHYQMSLQQARTDLPRFRRFGSEPAYVDGWGLYAASLGEELGLYPDDAARAGGLARQMACAAALVVDTGVHSQGWTRAQAEDFLRVQLAVDRPVADLLIDRIAARPADALACTMGELKIQSLRAQAQQALGARFDVREFHAELLKDGAMPLEFLEEKMKTWLETKR